MKKSLQSKLEELCRIRLGADYGDITFEQVKCIFHNDKLIEIQLVDGNKKVILREEE